MLSHRLKVARKSKKLTQEQLAVKVQTTKGTISNYENGHSTPSNEMLVLLAKTLNVTTDYLLDNTDELHNFHNKKKMKLSSRLSQTILLLKNGTKSCRSQRKKT
ncbi:helix-turn-helix domain-containing protein [Lysinibacillus fusiformis]|uniref:helix-turn-helix domain-containing protein n=1 Tax=Lysinibacillus fusiformis TaxID=28031 RepID=UPI003B979DDE